MEWKNSWRQNTRYTRLNELVTAENLEKFIWLTGLVPLYIHRFSVIAQSPVVQNFDDLLSLYNGDVSEGGGGWVAGRLLGFYGEVLKDSVVRQVAIPMLVRALSGQENPVIYPSAYNPQFFSVNSDSTILSPINGIVVLHARSLLNEFCLLDFHGHVNQDWVNAGLQHANPSMREFCFETYVLLHLPTIMKGHMGSARSFDEVIAFTGNFPTPAQIAARQDLGCTLYVPIKWNLRYVDAVIRVVEKVENRAERGPNTRKRNFQTIYIKRVTVIPVQITVQEPTVHAHTLNFVTAQHNGRTDLERYTHPSDNVYRGVGIDAVHYSVFEFERQLTWIVPSTTAHNTPVSIVPHVVLDVPVLN